MPAMKLTPNAAMRARDVSRPRAEHLAEAEAAEASTPGDTRARTASGDAAKGNTGREGQGRDIPGRDSPGRDGPAAGRAGTRGRALGVRGNEAGRCRAGRGRDEKGGTTKGGTTKGGTTKGGTTKGGTRRAGRTPRCLPGTSARDGRVFRGGAEGNGTPADEAARPAEEPGSFEG